MGQCSIMPCAVLAPLSDGAMGHVSSAALLVGRSKK